MKTRVVLKTLICSIILVVIIYGIYYISENKKYMTSNDMFTGSYKIIDVARDENFPADFIVSIGENIRSDVLNEIAKKCSIDLSKENWLYSYIDNKVFIVEKRKTKLFIYDKGDEIGVIDSDYKMKLNNYYYELEKVQEGIICP